MSLRAGIRVSLVSIAWTVVASSAAVVLGLRAHSIVLVAFGLTGLLDAGASTVLVMHFRHALRHEEISPRRERLALTAVIGGLGVVIVGTIAASVHRLTTHGDAESSAASVALTAASVAVLVALSRQKLRVAARIPSPALRADGMLTATGAALALITLVGTGLRAGFGWWWADPVAALGVAIGATALGVLLSRD